MASYRYKITGQLADKARTFTEEAREAIQKSVAVYNAKSILARNPKAIDNVTFSENLMMLVLESQAELPHPTKALRMLSQDLVETSILGDWVKGKSLFKLMSEPLSPALPEEEGTGSLPPADPTPALPTEEEFVHQSLEEKLLSIYRAETEILRLLRREGLSKS